MLQRTSYNTHYDVRGNLTVLFEVNRYPMPFEIKRVFYIHDVPRTTLRGGHAHKECEQVLIATSGTVTIIVDDAMKYILDYPNQGLYVPAGYHIDIYFQTKDATLLVFASEPYDENDYIIGE